jgi:uncharacterized tellurite resistance protein B-like protein
MALRRWLGLPKTTGPDESAAPGGQGASGPYGPGTAPPVSAASTAGGPGPAPAPGPTGDTQTVRAIVAQLEAMPRDQARYLAGFAYVLSRAAQADLSISEAETRRMEQIVVEHGKLPEAQAVIVVEIAKTRADLFGATEDYLVTREFRKTASDAQCLDLLRCCFLVGVADDTITAEESGTLNSIAEELQVDAKDLTALRAEFAEQSAALQAMRRMTT